MIVHEHEAWLTYLVSGSSSKRTGLGPARRWCDSDPRLHHAAQIPGSGAVVLAGNDERADGDFVAVSMDVMCASKVVLVSAAGSGRAPMVALMWLGRQVSLEARAQHDGGSGERHRRQSGRAPMVVLMWLGLLACARVVAATRTELDRSSPRIECELAAASDQRATGAGYHACHHLPH